MFDIEEQPLPLDAPRVLDSPRRQQRLNTKGSVPRAVVDPLLESVLWMAGFSDAALDLLEDLSLITIHHILEWQRRISSTS